MSNENCANAAISIVCFHPAHAVCCNQSNIWLIVHFPCEIFGKFDSHIPLKTLLLLSMLCDSFANFFMCGCKTACILQKAYSWCMKLSWILNNRSYPRNVFKSIELMLPSARECFHMVIIFKQWLVLCQNKTFWHKKLVTTLIKNNHSW